MLRAIFIIFIFQLTGEAIKKFFEINIPGPVIGLILLLLTLIYLRRFKKGKVKDLKEDITNTGNYILSYLSLLFVPIGVGVVMHLAFLEKNLINVIFIIFLSTILTIGFTAYVMEKLNKRLDARKR
ncbi:MAG: CidA/LrgA family protein [Candidatus Fonsibacter sp.]|jgi:holin-like protein|nr:antiholin [Pelagibacterales bacterium]